MKDNIADYSFKKICDSCIHNTVCAVKNLLKETDVKTNHPYILVNIGCTEYKEKELPKNPRTISAERKIEQKNICDSNPFNDSRFGG